jgi:hypothetical protein
LFPPIREDIGSRGGNPSPEKGKGLSEGQGAGGLHGAFLPSDQVIYEGSIDKGPPNAALHMWRLGISTRFAGDRTKGPEDEGDDLIAGRRSELFEPSQRAAEAEAEQDGGRDLCP